MAKRSLESALSASLRAEQQAVEKRLTGLSERAAKADAVLRGQEELAGAGLPPSREAEGDPGSQLRRAGHLQDKSEDREEGERASERVVRANFSMPVADYELIGRLRERCSQHGTILSRSEILRAGLHALHHLPSPQLVQIIHSLERLRPGPVKGKTRTKTKSPFSR
jgi:hypothetical protein